MTFLKWRLYFLLRYIKLSALESLLILFFSNDIYDDCADTSFADTLCSIKNLKSIYDIYLSIGIKEICLQIGKCKV